MGRKGTFIPKSATNWPCHLRQVIFTHFLKGTLGEKRIRGSLYEQPRYKKKVNKIRRKKEMASLSKLPLAVV